MGELRIELQLWGHDAGRSTIGIPPAAGRYGPSDPADAPVEFFGLAQRIVADWPAQVASHLDCASPKPWSAVPTDTDAIASFRATRGAIVLDDPDGDEVRFHLDHLVFENDGDHGPSPGGVLDGDGVFRACDVDRYLDPPPPPATP